MDFREIIPILYRENFMEAVCPPLPDNQPTILPKLLLTYDEVAQTVGVVRQTVWKWVREGNFPQPVKVSGTVRFRARDIEDWVNNLS